MINFLSTNNFSKLNLTACLFVLLLLIALPHPGFLQAQEGDDPEFTPFEFEDPLGGTGMLGDLVDVIIIWAFRIGIPIIVAVIIWAGLKFLLARGNETKIGDAKRMLWWAIVGLAIILIGGGFVTLIKSILLIE